MCQWRAREPKSLHEKTRVTVTTKPQTINSRRRVCEINNKLKNIIISWEIRRSTKRAILPETPGLAVGVIFMGFERAETIKLFWFPKSLCPLAGKTQKNYAFQKSHEILYMIQW